MKRTKLFLTGMAALAALSFGLLMTGCDDGGGGGGTTPPPQDSSFLYRSTNSANTFALELKKPVPIADRAYTAAANDLYNLVVGPTTGFPTGASFQSGTVEGASSGVITLVPTADATKKLTVTINARGEMTQIEGASGVTEIVFNSGAPMPLAAALTLTTVAVPTLGGTVSFVETGAPTQGTTLTVNVTNLTGGATASALKYEWLFKSGASGAVFEVLEDVTTNTYLLTGEDVGGTIKVIVTAALYNGSASVTSAAIQPDTTNTIAFANMSTSGAGTLITASTGLTAMKAVTYAATGNAQTKIITIALTDGVVSTAIDMSAANTANILKVGSNNASAANLEGWTATATARIGDDAIKIQFHGSDSTANLADVSIRAASDIQSAFAASVIPTAIDKDTRGAQVVADLSTNATYGSAGSGLVTLGGEPSLANATSITVPEGIILDVNTQTLAMATKALTIKGTVQLGAAGAVSSTTGVITVGTGADTVTTVGATFTAATTAAPTFADGATGTITLGGSGNTIVLAAEADSIAIAGDASLVVGGAGGKVTLKKATYTAAASSPVVTVAESHIAEVTITAGETLALDDGGSIALTGDATITAVKTTFSGAGVWTATLCVSATDVLITSHANGALITSTDAAGTSTLAASGTPVITQTSASGNTLSIGAYVTLDLGGTDAGPAGSIVLVAHATPANGGTITFAATGLIKTGNTGIATSPNGTTYTIGGQGITLDTLAGANIKGSGSATGPLLSIGGAAGFFHPSGTTPTANDVTLAADKAIAGS